MATRALVAWSGGKDSAMTVAALRSDPSVELVGAITAVTTEFDRISIHGIRRSILRAQSNALRLPVIEAVITPGSNNQDYEAAWAKALDDAREKLGPIEVLAYGDLFLQEIRSYRERQLAPLGVLPLFPLWGKPTAQLAREFVAHGFEAYITCVDTTQLDGGFAGRAFDDTFLDDLPPSVDPCGERGEFHSCVVSGPIYSAPIPVKKGDVVLRDNRFQYCDLELV